MLNDQRPETTPREDQDQDHDHDHDGDEHIRDIYALTPPPTNGPRRRETWETSSHRSSNSLSMALSMASEGGASSSDNFTSVSREFSALVLAGSSMANSSGPDHHYYENATNSTGNNLTRIGEEAEEANPLAIVPDNNPYQFGGRASGSGSTVAAGNHSGHVSVQRVKREEVETKISAWQNAKIAKINNRFKREEAIIGGWESEQVQKATSKMKKAERKLEEKRARALEKMQNDVAKAHRKAEERRASAEAKRGTKAARVLEIVNLMKAVGRAPAKRSFF